MIIQKSWNKALQRDIPFHTEPGNLECTTAKHVMKAMGALPYFRECYLNISDMVCCHRLDYFSVLTKNVLPSVSTIVVP